MKHIIQLVRYQNLLMLMLMQLVLRYGFLKPQHALLALADWQFMLLVFSTLCLAAGGYIINDIMDSETDNINKPDRVIVGKHISEYNAYNYYIACNVIGVGIGFYLSNLIGSPMFSALFIVVAGTLYLYATTLKQSFLIGNILISAMVALSIILVGIFDLYPAIMPDNQMIMAVYFQVFLDYAFIVFILNLIREMVKDIQDIKGDQNQGMRTLPIVLGVKNSIIIIIVLSVIAVGSIVYYMLNYLAGLQWVSVYLLTTVVGPLIYFIIKIATAKQPEEFKKWSTLLKIIMLAGTLSIVLITLNMKYNA